MPKVERIAAADVKPALAHGALLAAAYNGAKFEASRVPGAMSKSELLAKLPMLDVKQVILLYCN
jgi:hypothetical protein